MTQLSFARIRKEFSAKKTISSMKTFCITQEKVILMRQTFFSAFRAPLSLLFCVLLIGVSVAGNFALIETQAAEVTGTAESVTDSSPQAIPACVSSLRYLPRGVTLATLHNGLTVIIQENHAAPVATVRCYVRNTGSAFEGKHLGAGLSHVLEHVVSGGTTKHRTEKEIERIIDSFGGATNAYTSTDVTAYYIDCPAAQVATAIELVSDAMQHCVLEPQEFDRELKVIQQELADGEVSRRRVQWKLLNQTMYLEHPARHPIIGYADILARTTREAIYEFYRERYVPNNLVMVVVGDVKTEEILAEVARHWSETPRGQELFIAMPDDPLPLSPREAWREMDGANYDLALAWPTVRLADPDLYPLDLAAYILSEGESSRLVQRLRYQRQLVLSVRTSSYTPQFVRGWFGVFAVCAPDRWKEAEQALLEEVYRLRDELVSPEELAKAKKQKVTERLFSLQRVQNAAESLAQGFLSAGDPLFDDHYVQELQKVTAEQIRDAARRYFLPERLVRVVIAPKGGIPQEERARLAGLETPVQRVQLANGLRVLLKRQAHLPIVNVQAYILGGALADRPETAGRSGLLAAMLDKGTGELSAAEIAEFFDRLGADWSITPGRNTIAANLTVLREDFPEALRLLAQCIQNPSLPEEEFAKAQNLMLQAIRRRADDPHQEIQELFADNLPPASPYHLMIGGKEGTVSRLTVEDLRAYHHQYFMPQNAVVTVYGDIDPQEALNQVEKAFGRWAPASQPPALAFDRPNAPEQSIRRHKQTGKPTGMLMWGFPGTSIRDAKAFAALTVLDAITSGYNYPGGWLHNELRGAGLVYMVHALQMTGPAPGYFVVIAQTDPTKLREVIDRISRNLDRAVRGQITPEELETAKKMIIALHAQEKATLAQQAQQAALDELYGLGYDYDESFDERIQQVSLEDIVAAARRCFSSPHILVTASPNPQSD